MAEQSVSIFRSASGKRKAIELDLRGFVGKEEEGMFVSYCPSLEIYTQGDTEKEARDNLKEAVSLFIECCDKHGTLDEELRNLGFRRVEDKVSEPNKKKGISFPPQYGGAKPFAVPAQLPELSLAS